jgi:hypothetical protein
MTVLPLAKASTHGQFLSFCNGVPTWGRCLPIITTSNITDNVGSNASGGGNVVNDGGSPVIKRGLCYNTISDLMVP